MSLIGGWWCDDEWRWIIIPKSWEMGGIIIPHIWFCPPQFPGILEVWLAALQICIMYIINRITKTRHVPDYECLSNGSTWRLMYCVSFTKTIFLLNWPFALLASPYRFFLLVCLSWFIHWQPISNIYTWSSYTCRSTTNNTGRSSGSMRLAATASITCSKGW